MLPLPTRGQGFPGKSFPGYSRRGSPPNRTPCMRGWDCPLPAISFRGWAETLPWRTSPAEDVSSPCGYRPPDGGMTGAGAGIFPHETRRSHHRLLRRGSGLPRSVRSRSFSIIARRPSPGRIPGVGNGRCGVKTGYGAEGGYLNPHVVAHVIP